MVSRFGLQWRDCNNGIRSKCIREGRCGGVLYIAGAEFEIKKAERGAWYDVGSEGGTQVGRGVCAPYLHFVLCLWRAVVAMAAATPACAKRLQQGPVAPVPVPVPVPVPGPGPGTPWPAAPRVSRRAVPSPRRGPRPACSARTKRAGKRFMRSIRPSPRPSATSG